MSTQPTKTLLSPAEYLDFESKSQEKHEYFRGEMFAMTGGSTAHNRISMNFQGELHAFLKGHDCQANNSDTRIKVAATGLYTYPDASVACKPIQREPGPTETLLNPKLIIEVLSPSTETYDRGTKFKHYRQINSLEEVLLVAQDEPFIERYVRQPDDQWLLSTIAGLDAVLELASIQCRLPLSLIYADVEFESPAKPAG